MKTLSLLILAGLAISFASPTFAQQKDTVDPKVQQQIRALAQKYDEAINKHDSVAIASLYAQNGVWRTYDHGSFYGQKAIEKAYGRWVFTTWQVRNYLPRSIEYSRTAMRSVPLELGVVLFKIPAVVPQTTMVAIRG
jgi:hypothetical protein